MLLLIGIGAFVVLSAPVSAHESCPPHHGEVKSQDVDNDGKADWLFEKKTYYPSGVDVEVWCLDHGPTGDYALRISVPGNNTTNGTYVFAGGCFFLGGHNDGPTVGGPGASGNDSAGNGTVVLWNNTAPDGRDLHFRYTYPANKLNITRTMNGVAINSTEIDAPANWTDLVNVTRLLFAEFPNLPEPGEKTRIAPAVACDGDGGPIQGSAANVPGWLLLTVGGLGGIGAFVAVSAINGALRRRRGLAIEAPRVETAG
jgi:hypothetical protein